MKFSKWFSVSAICFSVVGGLAQSGWCMSLEVAEAPTTDLALTVSAIKSAQKTLLLNIYELSAKDVEDALLDRIQHGVQVKIIEEGQPVGGMSSISKGIVVELVQAMKSSGTDGDALWEMSSKAGGKRRFHYDHAKYAVIDGSSLLIGSENYSPTGNPEPGTKGNRGWEVFIHDAALAQQFADTFSSDSDTSHRDLLDMTSSAQQGLDFSIESHKPKPTPAQPTPAETSNPGSSQPAGGTVSLTADSVEQFTAPNTSLSGLTAMIRGATKTLDIEQMSFYPQWGTAASAPVSPLLTEVLNAARRGVKVRVLLNDETVFDESEDKQSKPHNRVIVKQINDTAASEGIPIQAVIADVKAMGVDYIHNKGAVIDGNKTLISSINWDENAVEKNREAAVLITSSDVFDHYEALFQSDWDNSAGSQKLDELTFATTSMPLATQVFSVVPNSTPGKTIESVSCPGAIGVNVQISDLVLGENEDKSFALLSGQNMNLKMTREAVRGCMFVTTDRTSKKKVLEIRQDSHGNTAVILEGYTSTGKLFTIRGHASPDVGTIGGDVSAVVYDGHQKLGTAELTLEGN